jgi:hypothetical protein
MTGDKKTFSALHFCQQLREPGLGFQRADFFAAHGMNMVRVVSTLNSG